jgi:hypothetical protein
MKTIMKIIIIIITTKANNNEINETINEWHVMTIININMAIIISMGVIIIIIII